MCDLAAINLGAVLTNLHHEPDLLNPPLLLLGVGLLYCLFGWLLGSYTVLRWPWLRLRLVLQRLALTALASLTTLVLISWAFALDAITYSLLSRAVLVELLLWQSGFALATRLLLRWLSRRHPRAVWQLMAEPHHQQEVAREWQRNPFVRPPRLLTPARLNQASSDSSRSLALALAPGLELDEEQRSQIGQLQSRGVVVTTLEDLAQRQLERLPPSLLSDSWLTYPELPWSDEFSFQRKLKRTADLAVAVPLLVLSTPLLLLAGAAIWMEDRGSVFYVQQRSGWMGRPFRLIKLRTMRQAPLDAPTPWTQSADRRVTRVGALLRRTRLDELPQLINVLRGEMSLIGPRPEQPQLDDQLAQRIPHYRKRYWMPPGLSGWAQVCGPAYPASLEEAELKVSYDLYYLRNWSVILDLLILAKTIKTLLKVRGR